MTPTDPAAVALALAEPFPVAQLRWKPGVVKGDRALAIPYISAADVMNRLDKVLGVHNWRDRYRVLPAGGVVCRLSVRIAGEWLTKSDAGGQSEQPDAGDQLKAAFSDALKRAGVRFGIARYLHYVTAVWLPYDPQRRQLDLSKLPALPSWARPASTPHPQPTNGALSR
jgi:hypothetical protein